MEQGGDAHGAGMAEIVRAFRACERMGRELGVPAFTDEGQRMLRAIAAAGRQGDPASLRRLLRGPGG